LYKTKQNKNIQNFVLKKENKNLFVDKIDCESFFTLVAIFVTFVVKNKFCFIFNDLVSIILSTIKLGYNEQLGAGHFCSL
jgi:hypothetical protein